MVVNLKTIGFFLQSCSGNPGLTGMGSLTRGWGRSRPSAPDRAAGGTLDRVVNHGPLVHHESRLWYNPRSNLRHPLAIGRPGWPAGDERRRRGRRRAAHGGTSPEHRRRWRFGNCGAWFGTGVEPGERGKRCEPHRGLFDDGGAADDAQR
jgi:hypothetical protein